MKSVRFPFYQQLDSMDCAPTCLRMIAKYYGKNYSLEYLREKSYLSKEGVSLTSINDAAEQLGFRTLMAKVNTQKLIADCPLPCILHWDQEHYVVLYEIKNKASSNPKFVIADPAHGVVTIDQETFLKSGISAADGKGIVLLLDPTPDFYNIEIEEAKAKGYSFLFRYLKPYRKYLAQVVIGMIAASIITLAFPLLTQVLVDQGVTDKNLSIIFWILLSQLFLFFGDTCISIVRNWLLLHISARISLNIVSDFLIKLLKLPIRYFDTKSVGDISQRMTDHNRIDSFLTGETLSSLFSVLNILIFSVVLAFYDWKIVFIFHLLNAAGILWVFRFQKKRKQLDYQRFARKKENQDKLYEMIKGMEEIKLYGAETAKRWEWEQLQVRNFKLNIKGLALEQFQNTGFIFFTHLKNILVSFIAACAVIRGDMTLGALLSISYIIGQTNGPIEQLINFINSAQDARLSMDRLQEIHSKGDEEKNYKNDNPPIISIHEDICFKSLSFQYQGPNSPFALKDINLTIPKGKTTAIVGTSGSGKTTLMKLLLSYYNPVEGSISIGTKELKSISPKYWRGQCGTVLQGGCIFFETITKNIALDGNNIDKEAMKNAVHIANLEEFTSRLPLGYATKIGTSGIGISGGQKQRILIARAVYKNAPYLFFDEATSSLDANNEKIIMEKLHQFSKGKTVVIVAHRLSTVKNADQIIVLENGQIVETGNHETLTRMRGKYFELVKNQLELGE